MKNHIEEDHIFEKEFDFFMQAENNRELERSHQRILFKNVLSRINSRKRTKIIQFSGLISIFVITLFFSLYIYKNTYKHPGELNESLVFNNDGTPKKILLEDGTEVLLEKNSSIKYSKAKYNLTERNIYLTGTATFYVHKDPTKPFIVHSNNIEIKALGTTFKVNSQTLNKNATSVFLYEGKVSINSTVKINNVTAKETHPKSIILQPKNGVTLDSSFNKISNFTSSNYLKEKANKLKTSPLIFDNDTLSDVIHYISLNYNYEIIFDKKITDNILFTGTLDKEKSLDRNLEIICQMNHLRYVKYNNYILIEKN